MFIIFCILCGWFLFFILNVFLYINELKEVHEEYGWAINPFITSFFGICYLFLRGPAATWQKFLEYHLQKKVKRILKKVRDQGTTNEGKPLPDHIKDDLTTIIDEL